MATTQTTTNGEVLGVAVNVCVDGVMSVFQERMRNILDDNDIERPDPYPDEWYPLDKFLAVLKVVEKDVGENALKKIGESTPQFVDWPNSPDTPAQALEGLVDIFMEYHRNVSGKYQFEQTGDTSARVTSTTPYPDTWEAGFLKGTAEVHGSKYTRVEIIETAGDEIVYEINW